MITLKEAKNYLRVDYDEDDKLIQNLLSTSKQLVMDVGRMDESAFVENEDTVRTAMLFALGYLYENAVAQILAANGNELFYYTMMNEVSKHNYEIDFLLARKNKVCPIEVKSSGYKTHRSLDVFTEKYSSRILNRYLVYTKDFARENDIYCLPVYMVPYL